MTDKKSHAEVSPLPPATPKNESLGDAGPVVQRREFGGPKGPEPTRYGDWEQKGRCTDF